MHASELKVEFNIDPESQLLDIPNDLNRNQLVTVLGNVLNNAFDAALAGERPPRVDLFMSDFGNDLIFEIADSGSGVPESMRHSILSEGCPIKRRKARLRFTSGQHNPENVTGRHQYSNSGYRWSTLYHRHSET